MSIHQMILHSEFQYNYDKLVLQVVPITLSRYLGYLPRYLWLAPSPVLGIGEHTS